MIFYTVTKTILTDKYWVAPESLEPGTWIKGSPEGDVYSFAIIISEIFSRQPPFHHKQDKTPQGWAIKKIFFYNLQ